ncbi:MAG: ferrochelatase [Gammaproteobacteria bacterium]|nr:ferrochelatase [Gammaproteobacteria bacterium]
MTRYQSPPVFSHDDPACTGILITNLGTPDAPTTSAVRRYLAEFLSDPRVVEMPRWLWMLALHGIILRIRPPRAAKAYRSIWHERGSPLLYISEDLHKALQQACHDFPGPVRVELAMRYGKPSIEAGLNALQQAGARRILIFPLYPQYSATTTATTFDAVSKILQKWRWMPEIRMINHYHDHPAYIQAVADSVRQHWQNHGQADKLLFSFHGLPKKNLDLGDPYFCECSRTARLVAENLQLAEDQWQLCFQSRFGREEWLQPYTDHTLKQWGEQGIKHVQVICPGFSVDCLETLEEIAVENRDVFLNAGGKEYSYIPALNADTSHAQMLKQIIQQHTSGWPETDTPK